MSWLLNRLRRKPEQMSEMEVAVAHGLVSAETGRQTSELEQQKQLAENGLLVNDPHLQSLIAGMGKSVFVDDKNIMGGGKDKIYTSCIPKYVALGILNTSLIRTSWLDPLEAQIAIVRSRRILRRIKMKMTEDDYESGGALIVDAVGQVNNANILSAVNGRTAKLVKVTARSMEVSVQGSGRKNQRQGAMQ